MKPSTSVATAPFGLVTVTVRAPSAPAGVTAVNVVGPATTTDCAALAPMWTAGIPPVVAKLFPVTVIVVPPAIGPEDGVTDVIVRGPAAWVTLKVLHRSPTLDEDQAGAYDARIG